MTDSTDYGAAAADVRVLADAVRGNTDTFVTGGTYALGAARNLDRAAAHLQAGRHDHAVRELAAASRRLVLHKDASQAEADRRAARKGGADTHGTRYMQQIAGAAGPLASRAAALHGAAAAAHPQQQPPYPRTIRVTGPDGHDAWHTVHRPERFAELQEHADRNGQEIRDEPLPDLLADEARSTRGLHQTALRHGWDTAYSPHPGGARIDACHPDRPLGPVTRSDQAAVTQAWSAGKLDSRDAEPLKASLAKITGNPAPGTRPAAPPEPQAAAMSSLAARARLMAWDLQDSVPAPGPLHERAAVSLRKAAEHFDQAEPDAGRRRLREAQRDAAAAAALAGTDAPDSAGAAAQAFAGKAAALAARAGAADEPDPAAVARARALKDDPGKPERMAAFAAASGQLATAVRAVRAPAGSPWRYSSSSASPWTLAKAAGYLDQAEASYLDGREHDGIDAVALAKRELGAYAYNQHQVAYRARDHARAVGPGNAAARADAERDHASAVTSLAEHADHLDSEARTRFRFTDCEGVPLRCGDEVELLRDTQVGNVPGGTRGIIAGIEHAMAAMDPYDSALGRVGTSPHGIRLTRAVPGDGPRYVQLMYTDLVTAERQAAWYVVHDGAGYDALRNYADQAGMFTTERNEAYLGPSVPGPVRQAHDQAAAAGDDVSVVPGPGEDGSTVYMISTRSRPNPVPAATPGSPGTAPPSGSGHRTRQQEHPARPAADGPVQAGFPLGNGIRRPSGNGHSRPAGYAPRPGGPHHLPATSGITR